MRKPIIIYNVSTAWVKELIHKAAVIESTMPYKEIPKLQEMGIISLLEFIKEARNKI